MTSLRSASCRHLLQLYSWILTFSWLLGSASLAAELNAIVDLPTGYLLGAAKPGKWIAADLAKRDYHSGAKFQIYSLTERLGTAVGGKLESAGEPCDEVQLVPLRPKFSEGVIAIAGDWNALPRVPKSQATTQPAYHKAVREFLVSKGLRGPKVKITQIYRIDLEGDGEEEVLVSGTNYFTSEPGMPSSAKQGSYSFVLLRRVVSGKLKTQLIVGDFYPKAKTFNAPARYEVAAVLDTDGDGTMEVVVSGGYYEGGWTTIYRCTPSKVEQVLEVGCGA